MAFIEEKFSPVAQEKLRQFRQAMQFANDLESLLQSKGQRTLNAGSMIDGESIVFQFSENTIRGVKKIAFALYLDLCSEGAEELAELECWAFFSPFRAKDIDKAI